MKNELRVPTAQLYASDIPSASQVIAIYFAKYSRAITSFTQLS